MKPTWVYALAEPDGTIRYIGKSVNCHARLAHHLNVCEKLQTPVALWLRALKDRGVKPMMLLIDCVSSEGDWEAAEVEAIRWARSQGYNLLNVSAGGIGGLAGVPKTQQHRERIGAAHRGRPKTTEQRAAIKAGWVQRRARNHPTSELFIETARRNMKQRMSDPEYAERMREHAKKPKSPETRERMRQAALKRWRG